MKINNDSLCGEGYKTALENVAKKVNGALNLNYTFKENAMELHSLAESLGLEFDFDGNLVEG